MLSKWINRSVELIRDSVQRFPVTMLFALATTVWAIYVIELDYMDEMQASAISWLMATVLGIPLSIALHLRIEMAPVTTIWKKTLFAGLVAVIVGYGLWLPNTHLGMTHNTFLQWGLLFLAAHILVSISVHMKGIADRTFWAFNMHILMRFILGVLFTAALNIGVILAIAASDFLFRLDLDETLYLWVTFINHGIFMTAIIIAGIPDVREQMEWESVVPKALRLFCLYVLLPLAFLYLTILLIYSGKVILEWSLPEGIVGSMILYYAIVGYITHVLTLPFQDEGSKSTLWFGTFFRFTMPVVLVLFWMAIGLRVDYYGLTLFRGLVIYLGVWLTTISAWAIYTKGRPIVVIPASLAAVLVLGSIGPISISSMSRNSQVNELRSLISPAEGASDTEKIRNTSNLDSLSIARINSIIMYLSNSHGVSSLEPFIGESIDALRVRYEADDSSEYNSNWQLSTRLMEEWNIPTAWNVTRGSYIMFNASTQLNSVISGYDQYVSVQYVTNDSENDTLKLFDNAIITVHMYPDVGSIVWSNESGETVRLSVIAHLKTLPYNMERGYVDLDQTNAAVADTESGKLKFLIESSNIHNVDGKWKMQSLQGKLFIKTE